MDDRLQRRLQDSDPLTAMDGQLPDAARLDAIKEQLMLSETQGPGQAPAGSPAPTGGPAPTPRPSRMRPRAIGITALAATGLAAVLVVGTLVQPASSALAWDPSPTAATKAQEAAAREACTVKMEQGDAVTTTGAAVLETGTTGGGAIAVTGATGPEQGVVIEDGDVPAGGTITQAAGPEISMPPFPTELPPLVYMELHGTGAVAVFADKDSTAYCLLVKKGDGFELAGLQIPFAGGSMGAGVSIAQGAGTISGVTGTGSGPTSSGMVMVDQGGFQVSAMVTDYGDAKVGIIAGTAPEGASTVKVVGGPADGAVATVADGRFALWAPKAMDGATQLVARDASGVEIGSVQLDTPPAPPAVPTK